MTALLQTIDLSCERDDRLLFDGLNLELQAGGVYQVEGPNGSGKTTLLRALCGLSTRFRGEILWSGQPVARVREEFLASILFIGHSNGVKSALTPRENLQWYAALAGASRDSIDQALEKVGLAGFEDSPCFSLSAGQQRRAGLARLFLEQASLWVLDEPFTAIDKSGVSQLEAWIGEYADGGGTVLLTTHHELALARPVEKIRLGGGR